MTRTSSTDHRAAGFTLVELMVVLSILGLMAASVMLALPQGEGLGREAERFAARLRAAQVTAALGGRSLSVRIDPSGYAFERRRKGEWEPVDGSHLARQPWAAGTAVSMGGASEGRLLVDPFALPEVTVLLLERDGERVSVSMGAGSVHVRR